MRVPIEPAAGSTSRLLLRTQKALSPSATREVIDTSATDAIDASASPRKPSDSTPSSSSRLAILLVACRAIARGSSSHGMPAPLSATMMRLMPPASSLMSICVAPASRLFSSNSLTTDAGRSTTSPAAIWLISASAKGRIARRSVAFI